ncbi:hypothetical protein KM92DES2_11405 [uncultured Desulfovibrio sp.]|uniref:Uncharacterized protein n=1 Tax=uncultured Desulfovibrio sp. TaxID=167968 RepID=A0A212JN87_9BACT|nr:hypothetical protein KM92DES2_11405 [uncultured Desulfovibrio sp.]
MAKCLSVKLQDRMEEPTISTDIPVNVATAPSSGLSVTLLQFGYGTHTLRLDRYFSRKIKV